MSEIEREAPVGEAVREARVSEVEREAAESGAVREAAASEAVRETPASEPEPDGHRGDRPPLLELRDVRAAYDGVSVLHGVDLSVAAGRVVALLGPNGAGKTTTLRVAAGVHPVRSGRLLLGGRDLTRAAPRDLARAGVCLIPEGRGVFPNLSVRDNLLMMTFTGRSREEIEETAFTRFPMLAKCASQPAGTMSGGEQQMLALARGLATDPAVLLLDELSMGLAPLIVGRLYEQVAEIARQGVAVLVVEQFAAAVLGIADHAAVLVRGRIERQGHPDDGLRAELSALYLGSSP